MATAVLTGCPPPFLVRAAGAGAKGLLYNTPWVEDVFLVIRYIGREDRVLDLASGRVHKKIIIYLRILKVFAFKHKFIGFE